MTMAIRGVGKEYDFTVKISDNLKTTTSQFKGVVMDPTNAADITVSGINTSAGAFGARHFLGVLQSYQTAGSTDATVRTLGITKAYAGEAISAGSWVTLIEATLGANTGGMFEKWDLNDASAGAAPVQRTLAGRILQNATMTGQAVSILLLPCASIQ